MYCGLYMNEYSTVIMGIRQINIKCILYLTVEYDRSALIFHSCSLNFPVYFSITKCHMGIIKLHKWHENRGTFISDIWYLFNICQR